MIITLANLHQHTAQQIFDKVALHLLKQKKKATYYSKITERDVCSYRAEGGLKCAAGCLIADSEYNAQTMEGKPWAAMVGDVGPVPNHFMTLIQHLQNIHDNSDPEEWQKELVQFAIRNGLSPRVATLSDDFKKMCAIGHGCGLTTLAEAFTQCELHYDALWKIDEANDALNLLNQEIEALALAAKLPSTCITILEVMGRDWAAQEDAEMQAYMDGQPIANEPDEPLDIP